MSNSINVTDSSFEYDVIAYSNQVPVVVDFWATWCVPCKIIDPLLEQLADQEAGNFRLAKVEVDSNPKLTRQFNIRTVPSIKAFRNGQLIAELIGVQKEQNVRDFIQAILPSENELALEKGLSLLDQQDWDNSEDSFRAYLEKKPGHPQALLGLSRSLAGQSFFKEAQNILLHFPASKEYASSEMLSHFVNAEIWANKQSGKEDDIMLAGYLHALRLAARGNYPAALDGLLEILHQNKRYRDGEVRRVFLGILELIGSTSPLATQYRNELAIVLF